MKSTTTYVLLVAVVLLTFLCDVDANICCYKCWRNGFDCRQFYANGCSCLPRTREINEALGHPNYAYNVEWDWRK